MSAPVLAALAAAKAAGVTVTLTGDTIAVAAKSKLPPDIVARLKTFKPDLLRILAGREAAKTASEAEPPPDCLPRRWAEAQLGLRRFVHDGWGDQAALLGWTVDELYRAPLLWSQISLTGAALLIADRRVVAVTGVSIVIKTPSGSLLRFRRIGREHVA